MKFIKELLKEVMTYTRMSEAPVLPQGQATVGQGQANPQGMDQQAMRDPQPQGDGVPQDLEQDDVENPEAEIDPQQQGMAPESDDPDRQGLIRTVKGAHLVYKRQSEEGTYEELWIYNIGGMKDELVIRKAVLAGTDIPPGKMKSPEGDQSYEIWTAGNAEVLLIKGLPN